MRKFNRVKASLFAASALLLTAPAAAQPGDHHGDIAEAQKHRSDAEAASAAYQTALAGARARANAHAEETRKRISGEIDKAKADAEAKAHEATAKAEASIQAMRVEAKVSMTNAARDAAIEIVAHLTGETVSAEDAAAAVKAGN